MSPQATVRAQARKALQHNYAKAIAAMIAGLLPVFLIDIATAILFLSFRCITSDTNTLSVLDVAVTTPVALILGVMLSPFINGFVRVFYRNALNGEMELQDLYYYFNREWYSRTLQLNLSWILRIVLPAILFFLPVFIYEIVSLNLENQFYGSMLYSDFFFILTVLSTVILTLYSLKYFTVFTLYVEREELGVSELFSTSKMIMSEHSTDAAKLIFSYTPWMLLCLTVLPLLYVVPYMAQGMCICAKWLNRTATEERT